MTCTQCRLGRVWECRHNGNCSQLSSSIVDSDDVANPEMDSEELGPVREIKTYKNDATLRDQQSTGRKRAAEMYPLDKDAPCEWKMQKNCGGGDKPITGCADGIQQARHHGPDKNTLNNDAGNVHRICHTCHNRWHSRNDSGYVWGQVYPNHSPTPCSQEELIESELGWLGKKLEQVVD